MMAMLPGQTGSVFPSACREHIVLEDQILVCCCIWCGNEVVSDVECFFFFNSAPLPKNHDLLYCN